MRKFAIKITKGNDIEIISTHATKEEAFQNGDIIYGQSSVTSGTVSCILADFDENNNMIGNKYQLYRTWI